jgi:DNA repair exonuclease SbcCD ATPase subunit
MKSLRESYLNMVSFLIEWAVQDLEKPVHNIEEAIFNLKKCLNLQVYLKNKIDKLKLENQELKKDHQKMTDLIKKINEGLDKKGAV